MPPSSQFGSTIFVLLLTIISTIAHNDSVSKSTDCVTSHDCSLGGTCVAGKCSCFSTWTGQNCSILNLGEGQNIKAFDRPKNQSSWGGSVIWGDDGLYHMYAADMTKHCGLNSWQSNSAIRHLVSETPEGPFTPREIVQGAFSHNPTVHKTADGHFVIFHIGAGSTKKPIVNSCTNGTTPSQYSSVHVKSPISHTDNILDVPSAKMYSRGDKVSPNMLWSTSPNGPWQSSARTGSGESLDCNNPAAYTGFENGTVILICKVMSERQNIRQMLVAVAPNWRGPYIVHGSTPVFGEDAFIWRAAEDGSFHMLLHSMHPTKICTTAWSTDGLSWTPAFVADLNTTIDDTYPSFNHRYVVTSAWMRF
eukprot:m.402477 g.402477  ORF g.402477 m.402477 type:complete len:363 (+) comp21179_c0_seq3:120-1208(+)